MSSVEELRGLGVKQLRERCVATGMDASMCVEKAELVAAPVNGLKMCDVVSDEVFAV